MAGVRTSASTLLMQSWATLTYYSRSTMVLSFSSMSFCYCLFSLTFWMNLVSNFSFLVLACASCFFSFLAALYKSS